MIDTEKLTTNELFNALPSYIRDKGVLYHFKLIKGNKRLILSYEAENGYSLGNTHRGQEDLKSSLKSMLDWLIKFDYYVQDKMPIFSGSLLPNN